MTTVIKAATALSNEKARKAIGWILAAILSPLVLLIAFLCCLSAGASQHNNAMLDYCFCGTPYAGEIPKEFNGQVSAMRTAFSSLDLAVASVNSLAENDSLDPTQVKAAFFVLCSDYEMDVDAFARCFYTIEERTRTVTVTITNSDGEEVEVEQKESYTVTVPLSLDTAYANLAATLGREITLEERKGIQDIYTRIAGSGGEVMATMATTAW